MDITTESGCSFFVTYATFRISDSFSHYKLVSTGEYTGAADPCIEWCPTNKVLNRCKCEGSCADPTCTESCSSTPTCVCPDGFLMDGEHCIPRENCTCFIEEAENGQGVVLTVFQRRVDSSVDFFLYWDDYKDTFGDVDGNFWLGNDKLAALTSQTQYELRIDFVSKSGEHYYAKYSSFSVGNEATNYLLSVSGYDSSSTVVK
ncbi:hypothetical protein BSL78_18940 [Apostichopus japonicus]|uniref:Fibrinogen C-terminal domain-containing protein n=1 Tax=Stichopus japonicus TaxID=307972 RepID=A0A2G8K866_STIJA|nr:hypothetical protein BSL78_18940 [Apostichopus japonicus]